MGLRAYEAPARHLAPPLGIKAHLIRGHHREPMQVKGRIEAVCEEAAPETGQVASKGIAAKAFIVPKSQLNVLASGNRAASLIA